MRAIQRINHNAAICEDGAGRQLIALGRGIGFGDMPHEVDLDVITRTFYGIDSKYLAFIDEVDPEVLVMFLCRSGARSNSAANLAAASGYTNAYNILEGFEGDKDANGHRNKVGGWRHAGLPWIQG